MDQLRYVSHQSRPQGVRVFRLLVVAVLAAVGGAGAVQSAEVPADHAAQMAASLELFKGQVRGLLAEHCVKCHGGEKTKGEFDLTTREGLVKGGESGPAIVVGKPAESLLVTLIRHEDEPNMPAEADKLSDVAIEQISRLDRGRSGLRRAAGRRRSGRY